MDKSWLFYPSFLRLQSQPAHWAHRPKYNPYWLLTSKGSRREGMPLARWFRRALATQARHFSSSSAELVTPKFRSPVPISATTTYNKSSRGRDTLGRRLLSLIFPKRSAVIAIRKWAEEGKTIQKYQLNRVVRELRSYKRYKHALEVRFHLFCCCCCCCCVFWECSPHVRQNGNVIVELYGLGRLWDR